MLAVEDTPERKIGLLLVTVTIMYLQNPQVIQTGVVICRQCTQSARILVSHRTVRNPEAY